MTVTAEVPAAPRRRQVPLAPMRREAARSMRALAVQVQATHPGMPVHGHLRDAARTLEAGNEAGAERHLRAAMFTMTPQSLQRNGIHDDDSHIAGRQALHGVHRHLLLVRDIADAAAANQAAITRDSYGDDSSSPPSRHDPNAGYGPGANAQKPTARQPPGDQALNAPARGNSGGSDPAVAGPDSPPPRGSRQFARSWDELTAVIDLSARTPMLEATPAPRGRPGGPGLYRLRGNKHSDYLEQVTRALIEERGMPPGKAYAIAWGALRRWSSGRGHVHQEVRSAASGGLAGEAQASAKARAAHGHAVTWDDLGAVIDLALVDVKTYQRTVMTKNGPVTQTVTTHNQNYKNGMGQPPPAGPQQGQGKAPFQQLPSRAAEKQRLLATAKAYRQRAALLGVEVAALNAALQNALSGPNTTKAQAGATTKAQKGATTAAQAGATTKAATAAATAAQTAGTTAAGSTGTTPAAAPAAATTAAQAGATTAAQAGATTAATAGSTAKVAAPSKTQQAAATALQSGASQAQVTQAQQQAAKAAAGMSAPQLRTAIGQLQARITWYNTQASALTAQAAKL